MRRESPPHGTKTYSDNMFKTVLKREIEMDNSLTNGFSPVNRKTNRSNKGLWEWLQQGFLMISGKYYKISPGKFRISKGYQSNAIVMYAEGNGANRG